VTDSRDELTPAERRALDALPREVEPPRGLEDRTVATLQSRGMLAVPLRPIGAVPRRWQPAWLVGAAAASLALFASGMAVGQYLGARTATIAAAVGAGSMAQRVQNVERTSNQYLEALASFSQWSDSADAGTRARATQAALRSFTAAAREMARLAPDDPLAAAVLRGLADRSRQGSPAPTRTVVWY
jgi:hypothetical protein